MHRSRRHSRLFLFVLALGLFALPGVATAETCTEAFVADRAASALLRVDLGTGAQTVPSQGNLLTAVSDIARAPDGKLYAFSMAARAVVVVDPSTGAQSRLTPQPLPSSDAGDIAVGPDGSIYVASYGSPTIVRVDPLTGAQTQFATNSSLFPQTSDLLVEPGGDLLLALPNRLVRVDAVTRTTTLLASPAVEFDVRGLTLGTDGTIYAGTSSGNIYKVDPTSGASERIVSSSTLGFISDLELLPNGGLLVTSISPADRVSRTSVTGATPQVVAEGPPMTFPESAAVLCDVYGPTLEDAPDLTVATDTGAPHATVDFPVPEATDPTDADVEVTCDPAAGSQFAIGTTTVTCTARDAAGNTDSDTFTVTVEDREPPVIDAGEDRTAGTDPGKATATVSLSPVASDNSGDVAVACEPASGSEFALGTTTVTCTATDDAGHTAADEVAITVVDREAPTLDAGPDQTLPTDPDKATAAVSFSPTAADNVAVPSVSCSPPSGSDFDIGTTTVTCTASDNAGNSSQDSLTITVVDRQAPSIEDLPDRTVATDPGKSTAELSFAPSATDNSGDVGTECSPASGSDFPIGTTTVTCTATDGSGNSVSDQFDVRVEDREAPSLSLPPDIAVQVDEGASTATVNYDVLADDNSGATPQVECSPISGTAFAVGTTTVTCEATDAAGNATTGSFSVTVTEPPPPNPTTKAECRDRPGFQVFPGFKNRGDCVSFVATGGRNEPSDSP